MFLCPSLFTMSGCQEESNRPVWPRTDDVEDIEVGVRDVTLAGWMFTGRPLWLVGSWWATNLGWPLEYCFYRLLLYSFLAFHIIIHHLLNIIEWIYGQLISNYLTNKWWFTWVAASQVRTFQVAAPVFAAQSYGPFGAMAQVELARGHLSHETYRPVDWLIQVVY